jgi:hypothetical protein
MASGRDMTVSQVGQVEQIVLMGEGGTAQPMSKVALVDLFYVLRDNVQLVLLNACHSVPIAEALAEVVHFTIGMSGSYGVRLVPSPRPRSRRGSPLNPS